MVNANILEYVQPTGAHDCYNVCDLILWENTTYQSKINANVWSPSDYPNGWEVVNDGFIEKN